MSKLLTTTALFMALGVGLAAAQQTPPASDTPSATPATPSAPAGERFLTRQNAAEVSAADLVNASVYDSTDRKIGEVNDLIMTSAGAVEVAVIGVGGFLGIGEKDVAVKFTELQSRVEANGDIRVTLNATKEQLQSAPEYVYLREQRTNQPATGAVPSAPGAPAQRPAQ